MSAPAALVEASKLIADCIEVGAGDEADVMVVVNDDLAAIGKFYVAVAGEPYVLTLSPDPAAASAGAA